MKNKKIILFGIFIFFIITYISIHSSILNYDSYLNKKLSLIIPQNIKDLLKETVFVFKNQEILKQKLVNKDKQLEYKNNQLAKKDKELANILNNIGFIPFSSNKNINEFKINNKKIYLKKYQTKVLLTSKHPGSIGNSYLDYFDNNVFIAVANGSFGYVNINELDKDKFKSTIIKSNIRDLIKYDGFYRDSSLGLKDLLIHNNKFYISYSNQVEKDCFNTSILVSNINLVELKFEKFFTPKICVKTNNVYGEFNAHQSGGRLVPYKDGKILFSIGEYRFRDHAQDKSNTLGKIISIDTNTKKYEIISIGHRNSQGLFYDAQNDVVFSSDHGPKGGDEININRNPGGEIENYGWPISSYGEHYGFSIRDDTYPKYKKSPLYKSHKDYGFIEPIKYFTPAIAISEIIKLNPKFSNSEKNEILVASMGGIIEEGDLSLHHFILNEDYSIEQHNILKINERIRDMIYVEEKNKILLFLESTSSIGVLNW